MGCATCDSTNSIFFRTIPGSTRLNKATQEARESPSANLPGYNVRARCIAILIIFSR